MKYWFPAFSPFLTMLSILSNTAITISAILNCYVILQMLLNVSSPKLICLRDTCNSDNMALLISDANMVLHKTLFSIA